MSTQHIKTGCKFCPPRKDFAVVGENNHAVAIICDTAKTWGHSLIIPKSHSSNIVSPGMDETIWKEGIIPLLQETIQKFKKNPQVIGFHINSNAGSSAEQSVFHTHIHLVPLYEENQNEWDSFSTKNFTSKGANQFSINNELRIIKNHINDCISQNILEKKDEGVVESFNLSAYTNGDNWEYFWIIPKTSDSDYRWEGGKNSKHYNFKERLEIAERIKNEKWEEKKPNTPKKGSNDKKIESIFKYGFRSERVVNNQRVWYSLFDSVDGKHLFWIVGTHPIFANFKIKTNFVNNKNIQKYKLTWKEVDKDKTIFEEGDFIEIEEIKINDNQNSGQNGNSSQGSTIPDNGNGNNDNRNGGNQEPTDNGSENSNDTDKNPNNWREKLKTIDENSEQSFTDSKIAEWQQEKGPFNTAEGVKSLLESVKDNNNFLTEIASKYSAPDLNNLIANKSPQEVITIIKRFEYDQLSPQEREIKDKKIKKHYSLEENAVLTDDQINEFCYKVAVGEINENSIKLENNNSEQIKPKENNILKIVGICAFIVAGGILLVLLIRKRKKH